MQQILPISELQHRAKQLLEMVRETGESIIVTQNGRPAAVLMNYENYEGWKLTLDEMSEPDWKEKLTRAENDVSANRLTPLNPPSKINKKVKKRAGSSHRRSKK